MLDEKRFDEMISQIEHIYNVAFKPDSDKLVRVWERLYLITYRFQRFPRELSRAYHENV